MGYSERKGFSLGEWFVADTKTLLKVTSILGNIALSIPGQTFPGILGAFCKRLYQHNYQLKFIISITKRPVHLESLLNSIWLSPVNSGCQAAITAIPHACIKYSVYTEKEIKLVKLSNYKTKT